MKRILEEFDNLINDWTLGETKKKEDYIAELQAIVTKHEIINQRCKLYKNDLYKHGV
jgi:hypothetical protein